ncbi:excalibur calcium-binding domain-containing protein [Kribbella sp. NPDC050281]|uniref:excalibur calcium-binding domain-containing protein n=1 Tax=Kribbella sp. NPDC050281 TaxID=3155515 RepID=UPI0033CD5482
MRKFNTPPDWPDPPTARWRPPRRWRPNESWPPAPAGWSFWVDERGRRVRGPFGRYGGPSTVKLAAITVIPLALIGALLYYQPFSSGDTVTSATAPEPTTIRSTSVAPTTESPTLRRTEKPTRQIERTPTSTPAPSATPQGTLVVEPTEPPTGPGPSATPSVSSTPSASVVSAVQYRDCAEVRAAGKAPLHRGDPGYSRDLDRNGDGIACERGNS